MVVLYIKAVSHQLSVRTYNQWYKIMRNFRKLSVWEKSHALTLNVYDSTSCYPKEELYGLKSQMRRSASSIPTNIAEGCGQNTQPQFARFLSMATGSASELEYQIILSKDLGFIDDETFRELSENITEIKRMLFSLLNKVHSDS